MASCRPVLAVYLDEVLGYFVQALARWHNSVYGTSLTEDSFCSYRFTDVWGGTEEESAAKVHAFFDSSYFKAEIVPVPGAAEALQSLSLDFDLVIVTSRQHAIEEITRAWVAQHYPGLFREIYFGNHWGTTGVKISKPEMCMAINAKVLIDDALHYARQCAGHLEHVVLFGNYAWNQCRPDDLPNGITRATDWRHALQIIRSLSLVEA